MRFHVGSEEGVDPCLIAGSVCFEPLKDLLIEPDGDRCLWLGETQYGAFEEGFALLRDIGDIDFTVLGRVNFCPVRPRPLLGSMLLHVCSTFVLR